MATQVDSEDLVASVRSLIAQEAAQAPDLGRATRPASNGPTLLLAAEQRVRDSEDPVPANDDAARTEVFDDYAEDADFEAAALEMPSELADLSAGPADDRALRDLVTEIVREELAGELGERITRNVRKLVRREIARAVSGFDSGKPHP